MTTPPTCYEPHLSPSICRTALLSGLVAIGLPANAEAYSTHTFVTDPCHEEMTQKALKRVREQLGDQDLLSANRDERALINDLPFALQSNLRDLGAATLVLGNRNVDFRGNELDDLEAFAPLHGAPGRQREHCLRTPAQDGAEGSAEALGACRAFIRERIEAALAGVMEDGALNPAARSEVRVALDVRGAVDAALPTYHLEMGRALHTIQDGFSHTYRTSDHLRVVTVLNYVELVDDTLDAAVDGPAHRSPLDACRNLDTLRSERLAAATDASAEFLLTTLDPALDRAGKLRAVDELLDKYFSQEPGCDTSNQWCDAPEERYQDPTRGCQVARVGALGASRGLLFGSLVIGLIALTRRRASRLGRQRQFFAAGALGSVLSLYAASSEAQQPQNSATPTIDEDPLAAEAVAREDARIEREPAAPWGVALNLSGAVSKPAVAAALGARYRFDEHWQTGVDVELNPWYAEATSRFRPGVVSAYASLMLRFPMRFERVNLRSTLQLGASRMMFDLYGVPEGTTGPYLGFNLLGLDYELGSQLYLVVNPAHIALPIPQTSGAPFSYMQYRITLGLQWGA